jgi:charged multivesicular body protein 2A
MFKKKPDQKTVIRQQKRQIGKNQRELDREIRQLETQVRDSSPPPIFPSSCPVFPLVVFPDSFFLWRPPSFGGFSSPRARKLALIWAHTLPLFPPSSPSCSSFAFAQEKKIQMECKQLAKKGQTGSAKILAKEIIRIRGQKEKLYQARGQLTGVSTRITTMQSTGQVSKAMGSSAKVMGQMNRQNNTAQMSRTMMEFDKQNQMADMKQEMMDDVMEDPDVDEEADAEVDAVLTSIGLDVTDSLGPVATSALPQQEAESSVSDADIEKFLAGLAD